MMFAGTTIKNSCPKDDVFIKAFMKELSLEENERLIDHTLVCKKCHIKFELLRQLSGELSKKKDEIPGEELAIEEEKELRSLAGSKLKELEKSDKKKSPRFVLFNLIPVRYLAVAAVFVVIVAGYLFFSQMGKRGAYREDRKVELKHIEPAGVVKEAPEIFRWTAVDGIDEYWFELIDEDLNTVYEARLTENRLLLPLDVRQKLKKGITYVWKVEAWDEFENVLGSDFTSFELR